MTNSDILSTVRELVERGALFVVSNSGGKDSQAMLLEVLRHVPKSQVLSLHATLGEDGRDDEGVEWPDTEAHIIEMCEPLEVTYQTCKAGKTFFGMIRASWARLVAQGKALTASPYPSPKFRQCTSDLKRGPLQKAIRAYAKAHGYTLVVDCIGLRAQESTGRAKLSPWKFETKLSTKRGAVREWYTWLPVHDWLVEEVFATIAAAGQRPHWAYEAGMERLSCCFCIMASKKDLRRAAELRPALYARLVRLERELGKTFLMSGETLEETTGIKARRHLPVLNAA